VREPIQRPSVLPNTGGPVALPGGLVVLGALAIGGSLLLRMRYPRRPR
jgi:hypothetical protein